MAWAWLPRSTRKHSPLLYHGCAVSDRLLGRRSVLFAASLRVRCRDRTERAGSIVRLIGVPSISRWQNPCRSGGMVAGCVFSRTRPAALRNDVVYFCSGCIDGASWIIGAASLHSGPRSRSAQLIGKMAYDKVETPAIF